MKTVAENSKRRVLLVDDEPDLVQMVAMRLRVAGYEVTLAYDGEQALEQARQSKPDVMILDLMLPKLDGYQVCRTLKSEEATQAIPILIFTARAQDQDVKQAHACGADGYLSKPFEANILLDKLRELLAGRKLSGAEG